MKRSEALSSAALFRGHVLRSRRWCGVRQQTGGDGGENRQIFAFLRSFILRTCFPGFSSQGMKIRLYRSLAFNMALAAVAGAAFAGVDDDREPETKHPFAVRLLDEAGMRVAGALAGVTAYFGGEGSTLPAVD